MLNTLGCRCHKTVKQFFVSVASLVKAVWLLLCKEKDLIAVSNIFYFAWFSFHPSISWSGELGFLDFLWGEPGLFISLRLWVIESLEVASSVSQNPLQTASVSSLAVTTGCEVSVCTNYQCSLSLRAGSSEVSMVCKSMHSITEV